MPTDDRAEWGMRVARVPEEWNRLTERIIGAAMEVHNHLGPGLLERLYEQALIHELVLRGLRVESQVAVTVQYKGVNLQGQRLDLVVQRLVVVENKAVERVPDSALAQMVSYLRSGGYPLGLLFNSNALHLRDGIYRRLNPLAIRTKTAPASP